VERYLALLRGVNVGGRHKLPMAELRALLESRGYTGVCTLIQSGNVCFTPPPGAAADEGELAALLSERFGFEIPVLLCPGAEWEGILAANPFPDETEHVYVLLLGRTPDAQAVARCAALPRGADDFRVVGRTVYLLLRAGVTSSALDIPRLERALGTRGTVRNWATACKLRALL